MKKQYFAMFLPVPGEPIAYDEFYINKVFVLTEPYKKTKHRYGVVGDYLVEKRTRQQSNDDAFNGKDPYRIKVRLFLCTRDIEPGDTVKYQLGPRLPWHDAVVSKIYRKQGDIVLVDGDWKITTSDAVKVLGNISPSAKWVKEGDTFTEDQLILSANNVLIQCSNCKIYH